jgi:hypothetical protein
MTPMCCPVLRFLSFYLSQLLAQKERLEGQVKDAYVEREKLVQEGFDSLAAMESEIQALRYFTYEHVSIARNRAGVRVCAWANNLTVQLRLNSMLTDST